MAVGNGRVSLSGETDKSGLSASGHKSNLAPSIRHWLLLIVLVAIFVALWSSAAFLDAPRRESASATIVLDGSKSMNLGAGRSIQVLAYLPHHLESSSTLTLDVDGRSIALKLVEPARDCSQEVSADAHAGLWCRLTLIEIDPSDLRLTPDRQYSAFIQYSGESLLQAAFTRRP